MKTTMYIPRLILSALLILSSVAFAADTSPPSPRDTELEKAKAAIARKDWAAAQAVLEPYTVSNPRSADGFNLLGYSLRNQKNTMSRLSLISKRLPWTLNIGVHTSTLESHTSR